MNRAYFNEHQNAHMDALAKLSDAERCWCGWYRVGECVNGCGDKSVVDRKRCACPHCKAVWVSPKNPITYHLSTCPRHVGEVPFIYGMIQTPKPGSVLTKAAVWCQERKTVFTGLRHADVLHHMKFLGCEKPRGSETQGFICQNGIFWDRNDASLIALASGQTSVQKNPLLSEDLWDYDGVARDPNKPWDPMGDSKP